MPKPQQQATAKTNLRRQLFVAPKAQGYMLFRVMFYCVITSFVTTLSCWLATVAGAPTLAVWFVSPLLAMSILIPFVLYDAAKTSNRMVGPFARVQRAIRQLANGDQVRSLAQRDGDCWDEWMQDFNIMLTRVQSRLGVKCGEGEHP